MARDGLNRNRRFTTGDLEYLGDHLDRLRHTRLVDEEVALRLPRALRDLMDACFAGADPAGLFKPVKTP